MNALRMPCVRRIGSLRIAMPTCGSRMLANCTTIFVFGSMICCDCRNPEAFFDMLETKYKFKLKGVGHPEYHLGGDFGRDPDGTLYWSAKTYVTKLLAQYERLFEGPPKKFSSPMNKDDHPELDQSELLNENDKKIYQSLIGAAQWAITLGRFDISV